MNLSKNIQLQVVRLKEISKHTALNTYGKKYKLRLQKNTSKLAACKNVIANLTFLYLSNCHGLNMFAAMSTTATTTERKKKIIAKPLYDLILKARNLLRLSSKNNLCKEPTQLVMIKRSGAVLIRHIFLRHFRLQYESNGYRSHNTTIHNKRVGVNKKLRKYKLF